MPGRTAESGGGYRFGFNGKENIEELNGWQDYGERMYNRLIARFPSPDPIAKKYPELSTYQFASNSPIDGIDLEGLEHMSYTVTLNKQGKAVATKNTSKDIQDIGSRGWGTTYNFVNEKGETITEVFKPSDPPLVWTGEYRPLYVKGVKVLGAYDELEGEEGFKNGGWQTMVGTASLFIGIGEYSMAVNAGAKIWAGISIAASADELLSTDGKSLSENILYQMTGSDAAVGGLNLGKSALSFSNSILSIGEQVKKGANVVKAVSAVIDTYGGVDNFMKAMDNFKKEIQQQTQPQNSTTKPSNDKKNKKE